MWPFRRKVGKHALGAAVSSIPSGLPAARPRHDAPAPMAAEPVVAAAAVVAVPVATGPRVELGFRDGSTAALLPGSPQAKALEEIASALTRRG